MMYNSFLVKFCKHQGKGGLMPTGNHVVWLINPFIKMLCCCAPSPPRGRGSVCMASLAPGPIGSNCLSIDQWRNSERFTSRQFNSLLSWVQKCPGGIWPVALYNTTHPGLAQSAPPFPGVLHYEIEFRLPWGRGCSLRFSGPPKGTSLKCWKSWSKSSSSDSWGSPVWVFWSLNPDSRASPGL